MLNDKDLKQIEARGASAATVKAQVERFKTGFPWMNIEGPAVPGHGIQVLDEKQLEEASAYVETAQVNGKCKFVPASGAASRMFKDLFSGLEKLSAGEAIADDSPAAKFVAAIEKFAFYDESLFGKPENTSASRRDILAKTLTDEGLGYGAKPKGVLKFHKYEGETRTAFAEHLVEAQDYMRNADGSANLVVTVSPEHRALFEAALEEVKSLYEERYGVKYSVEFTYQDKATDTVAVTPENEPFRTETGELLFRPAGHGALIHNLNALSDELVSIKNIDNVAVERLLPITAKYKKALMGKALELRDTIFGYLRLLDEMFPVDVYKDIKIPGYNNTVGDLDVYNSEQCRTLCEDIESFLAEQLCITLPAASNTVERVEQLRKVLDRPIRVCGMVKNLGEPGGGPFIIREKDGSTSLQILEGVQINPSDANAVACLKAATHFNPVDLVCCLHNYKGEKFDLLQYVDEEAGFISSKSYKGRELKALELPGLWNGSMSRWNTMFVEVPVETFNPVKVVLDLLRPAHIA